MRIESHGPPISAEDIEKFESEIGCVLPKDYRGFMLEWNGGRPSPANFKQEVAGEQVNNSVVDILPLFPGHDEGLRGEIKLAKGQLPSDYLPIAIDIVGGALCLSLRQEDFGAVVWSEGYVEESSGPRELQPLAISFGSFLEGLFDRESTLPVDEVYRIARDGSREDVSRYLTSGGAIEDKSRFGASLAVSAAAQGNLDVLETCIERGADLSDALVVAILNRKFEAMRLLVEAGANVNGVYSKTGKRPLESIYGVFGQERERVVKYLQDHGAV
jgi:hypothetical protein